MWHEGLPWIEFSIRINRSQLALSSLHSFAYRLVVSAGTFFPHRDDPSVSVNGRASGLVRCLIHERYRVVQPVAGSRLTGGLPCLEPPPPPLPPGAAIGSGRCVGAPVTAIAGATQGWQKGRPTRGTPLVARTDKASLARRLPPTVRWK